MRLRHRDGSVVHLAYCTNVHPADDVDGVIAQLQRFAGPVRATLDVPRLGVGLWLSAAAAGELVSAPAQVRLLQDVIDSQGLEVVTLNGFPYGDFHADVVKLDVYEPDWADERRLIYTRNLASLLAELLPADAAGGSISTLPFAWREAWDSSKRDACQRHLELLAEHLAELEAQTGRRIRIAIEPEPGCIVETIGQATELLAQLPREHLGLCLDTCHAAVQFEDVAAAVADAEAAGVEVVKAQLACALHVEDPASAATRLEAFAEPRFLHQTRTRDGGRLRGVDDLPEALSGALPSGQPWRVHFHTAIDAGGDEGVRPTREVLDECLDVLVSGERSRTPHLEVETYTWSVLPPEQRPQNDEGLIAGLAREVAWARDALVARGLKEES